MAAAATVPTTTAPTLEALHRPIAVDLDEESWEIYLRRAGRWLDNVALVQASFREQAEDVHDKIAEPHMKELLGRVAQTARDHEQRCDDLYGMIGRDRPRARQAIGSLVGKARALRGDIIGVAGGARAPWRDMHQLLVSGVEALSGFAAAEQLGYALGMPKFAEMCFAVVAEKHTQQLVVQELVLEMVPWAILYKVSF